MMPSGNYSVMEKLISLTNIIVINMKEKIVFKGRTYIRDKNSRYFRSSNRKTLHRAVWEIWHGPIPWDCIIHHRDGDPSNNNISNLECIKTRDHLHNFHRLAYKKKDKEIICEICGSKTNVSRSNIKRCELCNSQQARNFYEMFCDLSLYAFTKILL